MAEEGFNRWGLWRTSRLDCHEFDDFGGHTDRNMGLLPMSSGVHNSDNILCAKPGDQEVVAAEDREVGCNRSGLLKGKIENWVQICLNKIWVEICA